LGNHDAPRVYSRYGDGQNDEALARISLALMLTLRGTPFLYNGEEIGMTDLLLEDISQFRDNRAVWLYRVAVEEFGFTSDKALAIAARFSRDWCRTPMQWSSAPNGGFSPDGVSTWLPVNPNYADGVNVADQQDDPDSLLNFYKRMLRVRKQTPALITGEYTPLLEDQVDCFAFLRTSRVDGASLNEGEWQTCLIVLNMSDRAHTLNFDLNVRTIKTLFSTCVRDGASDNLAQLSIAPFEIYIGEFA